MVETIQEKDIGVMLFINNLFLVYSLFFINQYFVQQAKNS